MLVPKVELQLANPVQLLVVDTPHRPLAGSPFNRTGLATARSPSSISKAVLTRCHGMATVLFQQLQIRISCNIKAANCLWFNWKSSDTKFKSSRKKMSCQKYVQDLKQKSRPAMQMTRESTYDFQKLTFLHPTELDVFLVPSQEAVVKMFSFFYPSFFWVYCCGREETRHSHHL